ncbi:hypothetical protein CE91St41_09350 [Oscillospiraceae bacterium]|nr:hypothetical protein CE91St40_28180 [Oscillospiraceae bacterium]BDF74046.1 hypothetical protein CE91St41_09350 [Oscillospiraceae bacterium]
MARISKPPEVRRKEILDTAMRLFTEKGYEETSMADIARELGVVQGLCYRYFDSKQKLFREAMDQYVEECCARMLPVIQNRGRTIAQRMEDMARLTLEEGEHSRWRAFYHRTGNEGLHEELTLRICRSLTPCVAGELEEANARGEIAVEHPGLAASFLLHGEIGLLGEHELPMETRVAEILRCACLILGISR